jgi:hypothetical protein
MAWTLGFLHGGPILAATAAIICLAAAGAAGDLNGDFADPPLAWKSRPLWFWNGPLSPAETNLLMERSRESGYAGFGILPSPGMLPAFMTPEFLDRYKEAVDKAAALGMRMCLYDEYWFPSGSAGGQLAKLHPEALGKRLDMQSTDVTGPQQFTQALPQGTLMAAVAMDPATKERTDLTGQAKEGKLTWKVPPGPWKVMVFTCVRDGARGLVDYLDPEAVKRFAELTYQKYYDRFPDHFGKTIDSAFYDEPTFHWIQGGRAWTEAFNAKFQQKHGRSPALYYPALWFDVGPETAAARNAMFGLRAELYSTGFPKTLNDWCRAHKIQLTGHVDQEEIVNPVGLCGDLIKAFAHQDIPAIDQVFAYGRASRAYKLVSSAACNYDRPMVLTECYGGIANLPLANLYKEAMDQFAKGINAMVPHAVWYNAAKIAFPEELSYRHPIFGPQLPEYNRYIGRLQRMLRGGRHVADIAVLYPIATLQAGYRFGVGTPYEGGIIPKEADYMAVGELLALKVRRDFTFIHPEVLEERCTVEGATLRLNNKVNAEQYRVVIIPGSKVIPWSSLRRIKEFYDAGGKVIATTQLPDQSAEFGKDAEVRQAIAAMFGAQETQAPAYPRVSASSAWAAGGHDPANAVDGDPATRWNAADGTKGGQWLEVDFGAPKTFNKTVTKEAFGRTTAYRVQYWDGGKWTDCVRGEGIGPNKTDTFKAATASRVRLFIASIASDSVSIIEFEVYDEQGRNLAQAGGLLHSAPANAKGGKAWFAPVPGAGVLKAMLDDALPVCDVKFEEDVEVSGGNLSYIHKVVNGRNVYFFGNSSETAVDTHVRLRGKLSLELWDPHTGTIRAAECSQATEGGQDVTRVRLTLPSVRSVFLVGPE